MKKQFLTPLLVIFALSFFFCCWRHYRNFNSSSRTIANKAAPTNDKKTEHSGKYSYPSTLQTAMASENPARDIMIKMYTAPIDFWGKVIDEKGDPISKAKIEYNVADNPIFGTSGIKIDGESDEYGKFSLTNEKGSFLQVFVSKDGYYGKTGISTHTLRYGLRGRPGIKLPTPENPTIFVLRKKGEGVALARMNLRRNFPISGKPVEIGFRPHQIDLKIEYRALSEKDSRKRFDWQCRISTPGGGLALWKGWQEFDFEAPETGYKRLDEINVSKSAERWMDSAIRKFFVKTTDGKYACVEFRIYVGNEPFFVVEAYYNPSGSRNLEFDPEKLINK